MKSLPKYRSDCCVIKVEKTKAGKTTYKLVHTSNCLDDCFDYIIKLARKDKIKRQKQREQELSNFLDFGDMPSESKI